MTDYTIAEVTATATPKAERVVTLTMDESVALSLMALFGKVGGNPWSSPRGHINLLRHALEGAGVSSRQCKLSVRGQSIYFEDDA